MSNPTTPAPATAAVTDPRLAQATPIESGFPTPDSMAITAKYSTESPAPRFLAFTDPIWQHSPRYVINPRATEDPRALQYLVHLMERELRSFLTKRDEPIINAWKLIILRRRCKAVDAESAYSRIEECATTTAMRYFKEIYVDNNKSLGDIATGFDLRSLQEPHQRPELLLNVAAITQVIYGLQQASMDPTATGSFRPRDEQPLFLATIEEWTQTWLGREPVPTTPFGILTHQATIPLTVPRDQQEEQYELRIDRQLKEIETANSSRERAEATAQALQEQVKALETQVAVYQRTNTAKRSFSQAFANMEDDEQHRGKAQPPTPENSSFAPEVTKAMLASRYRGGPGVTPSQWHRANVDPEIVTKISTGKTVTTNMLLGAALGSQAGTNIDVRPGDDGQFSFVSTTNAKVRVTKFTHFIQAAEALTACLQACNDSDASDDITRNYLRGIRECYVVSGEDVGITLYYSDALLRIFLDARYRGVQVNLNYDPGLQAIAKSAVEAKRRDSQRNRLLPPSGRPNMQIRTPRVVDQPVDPKVTAMTCINWQLGRPCAMRVGSPQGPCPMKHVGAFGANPNARQQLQTPGNPRPTGNPAN